MTQAQAVTATAIAWAESGLRDDAVGTNGPTQGCPNGSRDRGLWQINDCYHPDVDDACAFSKTCNPVAMYRISSQGTNWNPWSTYTNGAYKNYLAGAQIASFTAYGSPLSVPAGSPSFDPVGYCIGRINAGRNPFEATLDTIDRIRAYIESKI